MRTLCALTIANYSPSLLPPHFRRRRLEMELMEKVRQVGDNYELHKFRTLNKTIELDARLANERLLATKFRLNDVSSMNDKLTRELLSLRAQNRAQERKLLVTETMLRQLLNSREASAHAASQRRPSRAAPHKPAARRAHKSKGKPSADSVSQAAATAPKAAARPGDAPALERRASRSNLSLPDARSLAADWPLGLGLGLGLRPAALESQGTQTAKSQFSRTKLIIDDLRRRLNLVARTKSPGEYQVSLPADCVSGLSH